MNRIWVSCALAVGLLATSSAAFGEPATAGKPSLGGGLRYGLEQEDGDFNPWGIGLAARGGITLGSGLYLGGGIEYYFGESESVVVPSMGLDLEVSSNVWQLMGEVGYDVAASDSLVVRPKAALGYATVELESCGGGSCTSNSDGNFMLGPGAELLYVGDGFFVGPELRYDFIFAEETGNALILGLNGGGTF